jgi:DnaJ-class molecular chaperone
MARDYYEVLDLSRTASSKEVRSAYRRLARKHHPDVNSGDQDAAERFKEVNEAYEVLSDPEKRKAFDRFGHSWQTAQKMQDQTGFSPGDNIGWTFGTDTDLGDLLRGFSQESIFSHLFGGRKGAKARVNQSQNLRHPVEVSLEEAYGGTTLTVALAQQQQCARCGGSGRGDRGLCEVCGGRGTTSGTSRIEVTIPPGVDTGSQVRVKPRGQTILLDITVRPHSRIQRKGNNLSAEVEIPLYVALLGGEAPVQTLTGQVALAIPPETPNGKSFRLAGQGMPKLGSRDVRGDLYVTVKVALPTDLSGEEKRLFQMLCDMRQDTKRDVHSGSSS